MENQVAYQSEMPVKARQARNTPAQAARVKAVLLGAKKKRLGEELKGTSLTKRGTGSRPCSPSSGLNSNAAFRKAMRRIAPRHLWKTQFIAPRSYHPRYARE